VAITGSIAAPGFQSAELTFTYANDTTHTWFWIADMARPINGTLAEWDTTTLTDGDYTLRLVVIRTEGSPVEIVIAGLRVRNYTPIETNTPAPTPTLTAPLTPAPWELPAAPPTLTPLPTSARPTLTPLPTNPALLTTQDITLSLGRGALGLLGAFALLGIYLYWRKLMRKLR
jgi:hypothetical protein